MLVMFRDQDGVLLTDYLVGGQTINGTYYASLIEQLHGVIEEKHRGKITNGVLLLHHSKHKSILDELMRLLNFYLNIMNY